MASCKGVSGKRVTSLNLVTGFFQYLHDEQEAVQKRTFTKWINSHLAKRNPPIIVNDLFEDIKDGVMLLALLEVLSGQNLPCEQGRKSKRIHWVSNIGTALKFLEGRRIKLVNINSTDIVDGRPSIVLGLIWTIILYFQIEELTSNLSLLSSLSGSTSSVDSAANSETGSPPSKRKVVTKFKGSAKKALLKWVHYTVGKRIGIEVKDFGQSWRSGFTFHSVIHAIRPDLTDLEKVRSRSNRENLESAFSIAENHLGIPRILDPEDVDVDKPDEKSIMTYVAQFLKHYPNPRETENEPLEEEREDRLVLREARAWLEQFERDITRMQVAEAGLQERYELFKSFRGQYEVKKKHVEVLIQPSQKDGKLSLDQVTVKQVWERVSARLLDWHIMLDKSLPSPLGTIGAWLHRVETILGEEIVIQQAHDETANIIHRKLEQHKDVIKALEGHKQIFHQIHRAGSVNGVPIPADQLEDIAERFEFITTASKLHLTRLDFLELKYRLLAFLVLAETKLKSWIIKYGRKESVQHLLQNYIDFFRHLPHWIQQHSVMNDAGNFLIETCDESVSRDLKQQLLLLNGRWRELFVKVKHYARADEVDKLKKEYLDGVSALKSFVETANEKQNSPVDVSFLNIKTYVQDMEVIKQKVPIMEAQYKLVSKTAQQLTKDTPQDEVTQMLSTMSTIKDQLIKVRERCQCLLLEAQQLLSPLDELEKEITAFFESLNHANQITSPGEAEGHSVAGFKARHQELADCQEDCKQAAIAAERNMQAVQSLLSDSKVLRHLDFSILQKKILHIQAAFQELVKQGVEWRTRMETNSNLLKRFEDCRKELEMVLQSTQTAMAEVGNPDRLLSRHTEFFGQLDQRTLNAFLKACDELTDILPEQEQQGLQDTVRSLHKQWKDLQAEAPYHLLRLQIEAARNKLVEMMEECKLQLEKENKLLTSTNSEELIVQHKCNKLLSSVGECIQHTDEIKSVLKQLTDSRQQLQAEGERLMDSKDLQEARNLHLHYQQQAKRFAARRREAQQLLARGRELHAAAELSTSSRGELQSQEAALQETERAADEQQRELEETLNQWQRFEDKKAELTEFLNRAGMGTDRSFSSLESLSSELEQAKAFCRDSEDKAAQAEGLLQTLENLKVGPNSKQSLQQQSRTLRDKIGNVRANLQNHVKHLEEIRALWASLSASFESLGHWVVEKQKELKDVEDWSIPLEEKLSKIKLLVDAVVSKSKEMRSLEEESQKLAQFVTSGEIARVKARLTQISRQWEDLHQRSQELGSELQNQVSLHQKHDKALKKVQQSLTDIEATLMGRSNKCSSAEEANRLIQAHQEFCQTIEQIKTPMASLSTTVRRVSNKDEAAQELNALQQKYERVRDQAQQVQVVLEDLLLLWQKYEKDLSSFVSWLERHETITSSWSPYLPSDQAKLQNEVHTLKELQSEVMSQESVHRSIVTQGKALYPTTSEENVKAMKSNLQQLDKRWQTLSHAVKKRIRLFEEAVEKHQQFDERLLRFSYWVERFLSGLQSTSEIISTDLQPALNHIKDQAGAVEQQRAEQQSLNDQVEQLCSMCELQDQLLHSRMAECFQLFQEANQVVERRKEVLGQLASFLETHRAAGNVLHRIRKTVETATNWDKVKTELLDKELGDVKPDIKQLESQATALDALISQAQYHMKQVGSDSRTSCRDLAEGLEAELESVQKLLGTKQSEAEALNSLWKSFKERKEQLLKAIEDIEEKADSESLKEPTLPALQLRLRLFSQLEEDLKALQHELQWLMDKAKQLTQKDKTLAAEAEKEINLLEVTWNDTKKLINDIQDQASFLLGLMRDHQSSKASLLKVIENSEAVAVIKSSLLDQEDLRRTLSRHEVVKSELNGTQEQLDGFTSKAKQLLGELKKIHGCDSVPFKQDLDSVVDQWLDVSERLDDNIERLSKSLALWEDVLNTSDEIDAWSKGSVSELNEMIGNLNDSQRMEGRLLEFQSDLKAKGEKLKTLHSKVCELMEIVKCQEPPPVLQAAEAESRKKLEHAQGVSEAARETLKDFSAQKSQMENYIENLTNWLHTVERSLSTCAEGCDAEDLRRVKELDLELVNQQSSIDTARENLNSFCRKYHSTELGGLGSALTELIKQYESINQLSSKTQARLQEALEEHFTGFLQEFQQWLCDARASVKECDDLSGDAHLIEEKLQKLEEFLTRASVGQNKLDAAVAEGNKLVPHLPKPSASQVQQQLANSQQEWESFLNQCQQNRKTLADYAEELTSFESLHKKLSVWLQQAEGRMATESIGENTKNIPMMQVEVERMEDFYEEIQGHRDAFDSLCQKAQTLNELGYGDGGATRPASQLLARHQQLAKTVKEKLRASQLGLQEHQVFEETLQSTWAWLREVQSRITAIDSTVGSKAALEKQLLQIQEILLMKGEGEVKLNMTLGKGEQSLKSSNNQEARDAIQNQLQALKEAWAKVVSSSVNCHSQLEWVVVQWNGFQESKKQLQQWMETTEQGVSQGLELQNDLKDKLLQLERHQSLLADIEKHSAVLSRLIEKAKELLERTGDASFTEDAQLEMRTQFADIVVVAKGKVKKLEDQVQDHQQYNIAVQELTNWLTSAKEELHRWSDLSGDSTALQRKLKKVTELIVSRRNGRERLNRVEALAAEVGEQTAPSGREALARELDALRADWQQWEESTLQAQGGLETMLSQTTSSEQEFQAQVAQLDKDLAEFKASLTACSHSLSQLQDKTTDEELVECWQKAKETEEALKEAESMSESLKGQLNDLCRFSKDLSSHSDKVSSLIKEYNSLCLQTAKYCQNKEKALEQRFRTTFREFQQWMINTKITTCFDTPQNIDEATAIIQKLQDFLSESEACQSKLNTLISKGELLSRILSKEKAEAIQTKVSTAKEDWKNLLTSLHQKEAALQNLQSQMKDFEAGVGPVQEWLVATEAAVQGSSSQLPDLVAKKNEQFRLQSVLEDITYREPQLNKLKEKAQHLWEDQASNKSFMHRVSQLSAWYLALSNLAKEKTLRVQRTVSEHQQFSQGLKELQDWLADARHMLESYCAPTADKNLLDSRMAKVEALLALRQEKEIQLKMVLTRGESVLRSTSPEGTVAIRQQMAGLKDSWDSLLSFSIQCKSQLEGALSQWTSYQDDVRQFMSWMDRMEGDLKASERQCTELRDKATALGKAKEGTRKAEEQLLLHQEYQQGLKSFEEWLEQEKENLCCCSHLGNDVETLESTLRDLEDLEKHCTEGQTLMSAVLQSQEKMTLSGSTYMEDRILESAQRDWHLYQRRLAETKEKVNATLSMLRKLEKMFQQVDVWLSDLEGKVNLRTGRKSDRDTKQTQLQQLQKWNEEILARKDEVERVGLLAHQVLEESHINSSVGSQATHLAARYQGILLHVVDQTKLLKEELRALEEADLALGTYTDWLRATQKNFKNMAVALNVVDKTAMENKIKKFEKSERAIEYLEGPEAQGLRESMDGHIGQLNELTSSIRRERGNLEKCLYLTKEFLDKYQSQTKWLAEYQAILQIPVEPKVELFEKKAQLAKYKAIQQTIVSHEPGIKLVIEKGQAVFELIHDPTVSDNLKRLQTDYQELCSTVMVCVQNLGEKVREHEDYNSNLQEVEKWLLQISTRLVAPDTTQSTNLEMATQHLARHKPIMEEIAGFEHALASLRSKGDSLIANCSEGLQGKFKHQVQGHLQGIRDSYSAICSTAQRLYQSLERELQKHVSHQDTLQQCQAWLHSVQQELKPRDHPPTSPRKSLKQVKHYRALQEQASTYLELLCSMCDLSDDTVKIAAADIQHTKQAIEQRLVRSQELALGWEEVKRQKAELGACFLETEQQLHSLKRRPAELELKIAQKQVAQVQSTAEHLEALRKLAGEVQAQRFVLDDLKEQKQMLMDRLDPEDKELIKEQSSHLERQWVQLEGLIEKKIQLSARVLEELSQCQARLDDLLEWAEAQAQLFGEALRCSPPAELAQTLLPDHIAVCNELESQELAHGALTEEAERILAQLGLDERQQLQRALSALHGRMGSLHEAVGQRRKYLSQALSDRTQFLMAVGLASSWVQQNRLVATSKEPAALMPAEVGKQIRSCKSVGSRLKEYQTDVAALWAQGRELAKEATEEETSEIMAQLQELQATYDSALQEGAQRLQELEKVLLSRKYFKADLDRVCQWMKQADVVTFPQVSLMGGDAELSSQLARYRQVLEQSAEHENLLLLVQRAGRELLPSLSEADHSFLDEKLNALPRQFNSIVGLAKEKSEKVQEAMVARQEYASLVSLTGKALGELEEQLVRVSKARLSLSSEEAESACSDCRALLDEVTGLGKAVDDLNQRKETFRSSGQPWMPDEVAGLSGLHSRLRRQAERQLALLGDTAKAYREHEACSLRLEARLRALAEELVRVNEETLSVEERLKNYHALAGAVQEVSSLLKGLIEQVEQFSPELDSGAREARSQQLQAWKEELQSAQGTISARIMECESRLIQTIDFQTEIQHSLDWLQQVKGDLSADLNLDVNLQGVQEEIRKSQILEEEVQSSLRIMAALSSKEKEKYSESRELMPPEVESNLLELSRLETEVQETLTSKKTSLDLAQTLVQQYLRAVQSARGWLDDASALLQQTGDGVDVEASEETLRRHVGFFATEAELASRLGELEALMPGFLPLINTAGREHVEQNLASLQQWRADTEQQAEAQQAILQR
ncbi:hypothetical protein chiPu_0011134 [Chiloscyllium punctatum]|uniref:Calponin-homology (CH) domain-containing protein n=1 Tax=Chiloscyllium punctatum TaxID=137246 RepID=A0A401SQJ9_CHIPU|nr:hypothetical protein [Chiloscyllium punctatum]